MPEGAARPRPPRPPGPPATEDLEEDEDDEEDEVATTTPGPRTTPFGSVWDSQLGVPSSRPTPLPPLERRRGRLRRARDPRVPDRRAAAGPGQSRRQGNRGGQANRGGRGGGARGSYGAALDRERYGRGGGGGINRYPDVGDRGRGGGGGGAAAAAGDRSQPIAAIDRRARIDRTATARSRRAGIRASRGARSPRSSRRCSGRSSPSRRRPRPRPSSARDASPALEATAPRRQPRRRPAAGGPRRRRRLPPTRPPVAESAGDAEASAPKRRTTRPRPPRRRPTPRLLRRSRGSQRLPLRRSGRRGPSRRRPRSRRRRGPVEGRDRGRRHRCRRGRRCGSPRRSAGRPGRRPTRPEPARPHARHRPSPAEGLPVGRFLTRGHPAAIAAVGAMVAGHAPHALLLAGPPGVGKTTLALDLAAGLLCTAPDPSDRPCRECRGCRLVDHGNHRDVHRLAPSGPGQQVRIGDRASPEPGTVRRLDLRPRAAARRGRRAGRDRGARRPADRGRPVGAAEDPRGAAVGRHDRPLRRPTTTGCCRRSARAASASGWARSRSARSSRCSSTRASPMPPRAGATRATRRRAGRGQP